jgi:hypothetical protein
VKVVSQVPADAKAVGHNGHQLPLGSQSLEEKDELEFEENYRVDARVTGRGVGVLDQLPHKRKIHSRLVPIIGVYLLLRQ